jgi:hypothetical protein
MLDLPSVIDKAMSLLGVPYRLGGRRADPSLASGIDCSEFTAYAYESAGVRLPWNAQQQYNLTTPITQPQPGDLVFFRGTVPASESNGDAITHVGLYLGGGRMIDAQDSGVAIADLNSPYWQQHFVRFGRVPGVDATDAPGAITAPPSAGPVGLPPAAQTLSLPGDIAGGIAGAVFPQSVTDALAHLYDMLTARDTWIRLALVAIGGTLVIGGGIIAAMSTDTGQAVASTAAHAAGTAAKTAVLA